MLIKLSQAACFNDQCRITANEKVKYDNNKQAGTLYGPDEIHLN
ncbi:hypothetical protein [Vreelandella venusta]|nr:hypothetical protein [Halomonas venusta]